MPVESHPAECPRHPTSPPTTAKHAPVARRALAQSAGAPTATMPRYYLRHPAPLSTSRQTVPWCN
eukprot:scaffold17652_cov151-Isochrysis_galbana.AAC.1